MNIAITGEGIVSAIGTGKKEVLQSLRLGRSGIGKMRYLRSRHAELPVGEVKASNEEMLQRLGMDATQRLSRSTLMGALAIREALEEARLDGKRSGLRVALISGTTVGDMDLTEELLAETPDGETVTGSSPALDCGGQTLNMARLVCPDADCTTISTACSAAANALALGAELLLKGEADVVIAGGTEALTRFHLNGFHSLMILDSEPCRPFDAHRQGLNLGEGAAYVVMERADEAQRRGADIHCFLTGWGNACDAFHQTASSPDGEGAVLAMRKALGRAGMTAQDIQYVNAHGTGTENNDLTESVALRRIFGEAMPQVSSTKGFTGHATSAAGGLEAVISILALRHQFVPMNLGLRKPMPDGISPIQVTERAELHNVMSNSFAFGGNDTSLIFSLEPKTEKHYIYNKVETVEAARVTVSGSDELSGLREFMKPMEARRLGKMMKASMLASLRALREAGVECPDAIVASSTFGQLENGVKLMQELVESDEESCSPTLFMQSTYNTVAASLAIHTRCHGYNITYSEPRHDIARALRDARLLIERGEARTVLVEQHDERADLPGWLLRQSGVGNAPEVKATAIVLRAEI